MYMVEVSSKGSVSRVFYRSNINRGDGLHL
ncbi:hypothetical protein KSS87_009194, partial [Heliosperma pusillum]